jgi:ABC-type nitrate/sulfonate/bicarbonate transport system substrate-binding protein
MTTEKRMKKPTSLIIIIVILVVIIVGSIKILKNTSPTGNDINDKVSVRMKWFFAGTMTGWFAGVENGFYNDAGIDLSIHPGGPDNNAVKLVASGTDTFGVAGADEVLLARENGVPIVAIAVLFKESPIGFISKKGKGIKSPADWQGKTVEVSYGSNAEVQYRALLSKFNPQNVKEVPYSFNLAPFLEDKVDVSVAYLMDQVVTLARKGVQLDVITAKEHGINPYGDVIITSENTLKTNPELVRKFVEATITSFKWSIDHSEEAVNALTKQVNNLEFNNEINVWKATIPFIMGGGKISEVGIMNDKRWEETKAILVDYANLSPSIQVSSASINIVVEEK